MKKAESKKPTINAIYTYIVISLVLALIIVSFAAYWFRINLYSKDNSFTEIYFDHPDKLPARIYTNQSYNYSFIIKSNENGTVTYNYSSGLELYQLYDYLEARYNCISEFRNKIFLEWTNETNFSIIDEPSKVPEIQKLLVLPVYGRQIPWDKYTMELNFPPTSRQGKLVIYFRNESKIKYKIEIDDFRNEVRFNGKITGKKFNLNKDNNRAKITVSGDTIKMTLNEDLVVDQRYGDLLYGQFGFESQDDYFTFGRLKVYRDLPYVVPDQGTVFEYSIDTGLLYRKIGEIDELQSKSVKLLRTFEPWNETINCNMEPFYCKFFDLKNDISFFLESQNITRVVDKLPVNDKFTNYVLTPSPKERAVVDWDEFDIRFSHDPLPFGDQGSIVLKFSDKWAIMLTRNNSYFMRPFRTGVLIDEIRNPEKVNATLDNVYVHVSATKIYLEINNRSVFEEDSPVDYTGGYLEVAVKNTFLFINPISMTNSDKDCGNSDTLKFCKLTLEVSAQRTSTRDSSQGNDFRIDYSTPSKGSYSFNLFSNTKKETEPINQTSNSAKASALSLNLPIYNPYIPDRRIVINSPVNIIKNSSNFSVQYSYQSIDGAKVMETGLLDLNETEIASMYVLERQNKIVFYHNKNGREEIETVTRFVNQSEPHSLEIKVVEGVVNFILDDRLVYKINDPSIKSGQFFIGSRNTYLETRGIRLRIEDKKIFRSIEVKEDPCELKPVYTEVKTKNLTLEQGFLLNVTNNFRISRDFDYGRIFVNLVGSGGIPRNQSLEIHFWVVNNAS